MPSPVKLVETYGGNLVGGRILDDSDDTLKLFRGELTGALVQVDIGLLAHKVGCISGQSRAAGEAAKCEHTVTATDALDLGKGVDNLLLSVNVRVEQTQNVVEVALVQMLAFVLGPSPPPTSSAAGNSWASVPPSSPICSSASSDLAVSGLTNSGHVLVPNEAFAIRFA